MNRATTYGLVVMAALAALPAAAQTPAPVSEGSQISLTGTIQAINATTREVTVKIGDQVHTFAVKPDVKRFGELKVGDTLGFDYHEAVLMEVRKPGAAAPKPASGGDVMRVPGQADLMFLTEQGGLTSDDLGSLLKPCRAAYETSAATQLTSPHARFDVLEWAPLEP